MRCLLVAMLILIASPALADAPKVVATIRPIHSLVAAVMGDVGSPRLLVESAAPPQGYNLTEPDTAALAEADVVFLTGGGMEPFLEGALTTLAPKAKAVDLSQSRGMMLYAVRKLGPFAEDGEGDVTQPLELDAHYWLDPDNAIPMVQLIAETLVNADPANAEAYGRNAASVLDSMIVLVDDIQAKLDPVRGKSFLLLHDGTLYFEVRFGLEFSGLLAVSPGETPQGSRLEQYRARIIEHQAACVFAAPQFAPEIVTTLITDTPAKAGMLDAFGVNLEPGPDLYGKLLHALADGYEGCFRAAGS